jgi:hypothetical protein
VARGPRDAYISFGRLQNDQNGGGHTDHSVRYETRCSRVATRSDISVENWLGCQLLRDMLILTGNSPGVRKSG